MPALSSYLIVFLGAGVGGALRHSVNVTVLRLLGSHFPYATLIVNVSGSLIMGLFMGWFALKADPGQAWRLFLTTGILGGFTTFSSFSLDTALLWERHQLWLAMFYVVVSVVLSLVGVFSGLAIVRVMK